MTPHDQARDKGAAEMTKASIAANDQGPQEASNQHPEFTADSIQAQVRAIDVDDQAGGACAARLKAALVMRGHSVYDSGDGGFVVTRWAGLSKFCPGVRELDAFARMVGAR